MIMLIGCGKMGSAMLRGWLDDDNLDAEFAIVEPVHDHLDWTESHSNVALYSSLADAANSGRTASMIVLAVKPQLMEDAIAGLAPIADSNTAFLSIAAGIQLHGLPNGLGQIHHPRSVPTPRQLSASVTVLLRVLQTMANLATQLLSTIGSVVLLEDEALMDAVTALSGSGPAYVFLLAEVMTQAGERAGLPAELAKQLAEATVAGAGALIEASDDRLRSFA